MYDAVCGANYCGVGRQKVHEGLHAVEVIFKLAQGPRLGHSLLPRAQLGLIGRLHNHVLDNRLLLLLLAAAAFAAAPAGSAADRRVDPRHAKGPVSKGVRQQPPQQRQK